VTDVQDPASPRGSATESVSNSSAVEVWILLTGVAVAMLAGPIAAVIGWLLPERAEVTSAGTFFEPFAAIGADIIRRTGWLVTVSGAVGLVARRWPPPAAPRRRLVVPAAVIVLTGIWYAWLSTPHNAYPSNARIHWVDYLTWDNEDFFYALGRIPHSVFYDVPWLWQGINAALATWLCYLVARRLNIGSLAATMLSTTIALSGNLLRFANTAEDVLLSVTLLLFVTYAALRRNGYVTGAALGLAILGRPPFVVLGFTLAAAELLMARLRPRTRAGAGPVRYLLQAAAVTLAITVAAQGLFTLWGRRYFLSNGQLVDVPELRDLEPREVDNFTIFPFSGTFVGHLLWVFPLVIVIGAVWGLLTARHREPHTAVTVYFAGFSVIALLLTLEANPLLYYNVRYLTYLFPLASVMAWSVLAPSITPTRRSSPAHLTLVTLLALAPMAIPSDPVGLKRDLERRSEPDLLDIRDDLRTLAEGRRVVLDFGGLGSRNYVAYVLRHNIGDVVLSSESEPQPGDILITRGPVDQAVLRAGDLIIAVVD
jgi:hypothetical protein